MFRTKMVKIAFLSVWFSRPSVTVSIVSIADSRHFHRGCNKNLN